MNIEIDNHTTLADRAKFALALAQQLAANEENEITTPDAGLIADALTTYARAFYDRRAGNELGDMERMIVAGHADEMAHIMRDRVSAVGPTDSELCSRALKFYSGELTLAEAA